MYAQASPNLALLWAPSASAFAVDFRPSPGRAGPKNPNLFQPTQAVGVGRQGPFGWGERPPEAILLPPPPKATNDEDPLQEQNSGQKMSFPRVPSARVHLLFPQAWDLRVLVYASTDD